MHAETMTARWNAVCGDTPEAVAVRTRDREFTFAQAHALSTAWARALVDCEPDTSRAIALEPGAGAESVVAALAVIASGHPLIMLDPLLPEQRRTHILSLTGALRVDVPMLTELPQASHVTLPEPNVQDTAIIVFTSGSTGQPKGVLHSHENWINQAFEAKEALEIGPGDRVGMLLPMSFGAGLDVIVMSLLNGAGLYYWDPRTESTTGLAEWLSECGVSTAHCTPSFLRSWLPELTSVDAPALSSLRVLTTCGESIHSSDVSALRPHLRPDALYCSWSGSSETGHLAFNPYPSDRELPGGVVPVGRPAANKDVLILDADQNPVEVGCIGEIYVVSRYLANGYYGEDQSGVSKFAVQADGSTRYRMGDLGRFDEHGDLHLSGRSDDAVKIRGYLVEPAEVEAALRSLEWVSDAVVVADKTVPQPILIGYVAVGGSEWTPSAAEVRSALGQRIPTWMVPRDIVILAALPRNERGKVDRAGLPPVPTRGEPVPLRGPTETLLSFIWQPILGIEAVGRDEDFTALGGDSLAAAKMLGEVAEQFYIQISSAEFSQAPTIEGLAKLVDSAGRRRSPVSDSSLVPLRTDGSEPALFLIAGGGAPAAVFAHLVREMRSGVPVYGIQSHGLEHRGRADRTIAAAAARALRSIRTVQPHGPYRLGGYSFGGFVALEIASLLERAGEHVEIVVLLDAVLDGDVAAKVGALGSARLPISKRAKSRTAAELPQRETPQEYVPQNVFARLWSKVLMNSLVATAGLFRLRASAQWIVYYELSRRMLAKYEPSRHVGRVQVITASEPGDIGDRDVAAESKLWAVLAPDDLHIESVPGDHQSILRQPFVIRTAAVVDAAVSGRQGASNLGNERS